MLQPLPLHHNPSHWYEALGYYQQQRLPHVLATIVKASGSAPRELQAKMVITKSAIIDTIGGGGLEFNVIKTARHLLSEKHHNEPVQKKLHSQSVMTKHYPLGAKLGQCCGGSVTVLFEAFYLVPPLSLLVFGAGHVAKALMSILSQLNCQVNWIDNRPDVFNDHGQHHYPAHINPYYTDDPTEFIRYYDSPRYVLVMTHDHSLDFEIVKKALEVNRLKVDRANTSNIELSHSNSLNSLLVSPFPYIGCIASNTKAKRFAQRLAQRGFSEADINQLRMPIGLPISGKEPMAVAVSIVAQVLQQHQFDLNDKFEADYTHPQGNPSK